MRRTTHFFSAITSWIVLIALFSDAVGQETCSLLDEGVTDCSNRNLNYVPRDLPPTTKILKLDGNNLRVVDADDFQSRLEQLEELSLSNNAITLLDTSTFCHSLPKLRILKLTRNKLTALPDLRACRRLVEIHCSGNELVTVNGAYISNLTMLNKLDLSRNKLRSLYASMLPSNTSLRQLVLTSNDIESLASDTFSNVTGLERVRLNRNRLTAIPRGLFSHLDGLTTLDLSRNRLATIQHWYFTDLKMVKTINLEKNELTELLDGSFYACTSLVSLNLESNSLKLVRAGPFFGLERLEELNLKKNNITTIDQNTWAQAKAIRKLDISRNQIEVIKSNYFLRAGNIEELNLARNEIHQIEESAFRDLGNLRTLYLSGNKLSDSLQSSSDTVFSTLSKLAKLDLAANRLQTISSKLLQGLPSLQELSLRDNPVTTVESYAFSTPLNLTKLELATDKLVCDCKISWLPPWLGQKRMLGSVRAQCALPQSLKGTDMLEVNAQDFRCEDGQRSPMPLITRHIRPTTALRGSNVTLTCIATTNSMSSVTVEWTKDNKVISPSSGLIETDASTADGRVAMYTTYLRLVHVSEEMQGNYQCGFTNEYGSDYSDMAELQVIVFPSFKNTPSDVVVKTGHDARLLCEATGLPPPFLSWSKDGGENFPAARDRRFQVNSENLDEFIIKDVQWRDRGVYYCNATNAAGSIISNATLDVMMPPRFPHHMTCESSDAGMYVLKCLAEGRPQTSIFWYKDGELIQASKNYMFSVTFNTLFIINATAEDSGNYSCSASNTLGRVTQMCPINIEPDVVTAMYEERKTILDQSTITGLIIIAVVCCVVGTSLVWVVIIYHTRKRNSRSCSDGTDDVNLPLHGYPGGQNTANSRKIGDSVSHSSSQSKSDSFLEYHDSSQDSQSYRSGSRYQTVDSELANAMEPLNPGQESQESVSTDSYGHAYTHHTMTGNVGYRLTDRLAPSASHYHMSHSIHPFRTFQPTRHLAQPGVSGAASSRQKPTSSISMDYIPHTERSRVPQDYTNTHNSAMPTQPPHAVITPVHRTHHPSTLLHNVPYEEPAYMNLPRSAVTPRTPVDETSDYMNIEPNEPHIYQNTAILNIRKKPPSAVRSDAQLTVSHNSEPAEAVVHQEQQLEGRNASPSPHDESKSADCHDNHLAIPRESGADNSSHHDDTDSATHNQRREALADRSFVEKKYGLFTEEFFTPKHSDESHSNGLPRNTRSEV